MALSGSGLQMGLILSVQLSLGACSILFSASADSPWLAEDWERRRSIELRDNVIQGSHEAFPWWIVIPDGGIAEHAKSDGSDILFVDRNGTRLKSEIEYLGPEGLLAWVLVDLNEKEPRIELYYDSETAPPIDTSSEVWGDYAAIYHMAVDVGAMAITDSTGNGHLARLDVPATPKLGPLGPALIFDKMQVAVAATSPALEVDATMQVSAWVNAASWPDNAGTIVAKANMPGSQNFDYLLRASDAWATMGIHDGVSPMGSYANSIEWGILNEWHHLVGQYDGSELSLYLDALPFDRTDVTAAINMSNRDLVIGDFGGAQTDDTRRWDGMIDEVRISSIARPISWIQTEFANQSLGAQSIRVGPEERAP